ncbi:chromate transporter (plasmid) [Burkholderia vietnamiensis]|nr:chromate transporter [Burkholderia vietnamiensis]
MRTSPRTERTKPGDGHDHDGSDKRADLFIGPTGRLHAAPRRARLRRPVALAGYMRRDLVDQRGWITEADYKEGMTLAQMAPGPMAAQLAIYLGFRSLPAPWCHARRLCVRTAVVPDGGRARFAYAHFGGLSWMQAVFYGVGAAVVGIIAMSAYKLTTKTIGKDKTALDNLSDARGRDVHHGVGNRVALHRRRIDLLFWRAPPKWLNRGP